MTDGKTKLNDLLRRMRETFAEYEWRALLRSHVLAGPEERKARMGAVIELSIQLAKIRATSTTLTWMHERAIECIVEGDWKHAEDFHGYMTDARDRTEAQRALWEPFLVVLRVACAEAKRRMSCIAPSAEN